HLRVRDVRGLEGNRRTVPLHVDDRHPHGPRRKDRPLARLPQLHRRRQRHRSPRPTSEDDHALSPEPPPTQPSTKPIDQHAHHYPTHPSTTGGQITAVPTRHRRPSPAHQPVDPAPHRPSRASTNHPTTTAATIRL